MCAHTHTNTELFPMIGGPCNSNMEHKPFIWQAQIRKETHSKPHSTFIIGL